MKPLPRFPVFCIALGFLSAAAAFTAPPRVLPAGQLPNDVRLQPLKDLDGYFPFTPPGSREEWQQRAAFVRRQILVAEGLWPMPTKTPLHAVIHGRIDRPDYTVEKVYFESAPGFFVTGNLYRPKGKTGRVPAVLVAHGHWKDARFFEETDEKFREELATGQERFEDSGRNRFQSMCVQLARMGCIVWQWDTLGNSDSQQLSFELVHRFAQQRPEMNRTENWGFFSPQAETHLQSVMGLQTLNSIRSLDFVLGLPEVDPERVAITGASGGATQTLILAAIDPRIKLSFPAVMVSTAMQGGCTCENCSLLRVGTGNVEIAALFAPKPQGMTTANDWTKEFWTKGFPDLHQLYGFLGQPDNLVLQRGEHFPHNYNAVSRSAFYTFLNKHFKLGQVAPVIEQDYQRLKRADLTVWDAKHPAPKGGDDFERSLARWWNDDAQQQVTMATRSPEGLRDLVGNGVEAIIGRNFDTAGRVSWTHVGETDHGSYLEISGLGRNRTFNEELPLTWLYPKQPNGRAVIWLESNGKAGLYSAGGGLRPEVKRLVDSGVLVVGVDLLFQGEFLADGPPVKRTRTVANPREFAGYTFAYNDSLFAQRVHDVLSVLRLIRNADGGQHRKPGTVDLVAFGDAGPIAAAARAVAGKSIDAAAIDTGGFRFGQLLDYRDPQFLPGGAKYGDLPGMLALGGGDNLWLAGETEASIGSALPKAKAPATFALAKQADRGAAVEWLLKR